MRKERSTFKMNKLKYTWSEPFPLQPQSRAVPDTATPAHSRAEMAGQAPTPLDLLTSRPRKLSARLILVTAGHEACI